MPSTCCIVICFSAEHLAVKAAATLYRFLCLCCRWLCSCKALRICLTSCGQCFCRCLTSWLRVSLRSAAGPTGCPSQGKGWAHTLPPLKPPLKSSRSLHSSKSLRSSKGARQMGQTVLTGGMGSRG